MTDSLNRRTEDKTLDVSIVIVSWNVADLLAECIESVLRASPDLSLEILVVDNASTDHTVKMLRHRFPQVGLIPNKENLGFARANNQAFQVVKGQYIFVLNPDTIVGEGTLKTMVAFMKDHPDVGMVGPRVVYPNGKIQKTCARKLPTLNFLLFGNQLRLTKIPFLGSWYEKHYIFPYNYTLTQPVEAITGAAMLIRKTALQKTSGFGEKFIHTGEDIEFCFRLLKAGWLIYYLSDPFIVHHTSQSSKQKPIRTKINSKLSIQEYVNRCFGIKQAFWYRVTVQAIEVPLLLIIASTELLMGLVSKEEFSQRVKTAKFLWHWKPI